MAAAQRQLGYPPPPFYRYIRINTLRRFPAKVLSGWELEAKS